MGIFIGALEFNITKQSEYFLFATLFTSCPFSRSTTTALVLILPAIVENYSEMDETRKVEINSWKFWTNNKRSASQISYQYFE